MSYQEKQQKGILCESLLDSLWSPDKNHDILITYMEDQKTKEISGIQMDSLWFKVESSKTKVWSPRGFQILR